MVPWPGSLGPRVQFRRPYGPCALFEGMPNFLTGEHTFGLVAPKPWHSHGVVSNAVFLSLSPELNGMSTTANAEVARCFHGGCDIDCVLLASIVQ